MTKTIVQLEGLTPRQIAARVRHGTLNSRVTGGRVHCAACHTDTGTRTENVLQWASGDRIFCAACNGMAIAEPNFFAAGLTIDLVNGSKVKPPLVIHSSKIKSGSPVKAKKTKAKTANLTDHIIFIIDDSGSMGGLEKGVIDMFNVQLDTIRKDAETSGRRVVVSLFTFSEELNKVVVNTTEISRVRNMTYGEYIPRGRSTALRDAIGGVIDLTMQKPEANDKDTSFLLFVLTDGIENSSRQYSQDRLLKTIKTAQATDRWTIGILGPPTSTSTIVRMLGIDAGNVREWEGTQKGVQQASVATASAYAVYSTARTRGVRSVSKQLFEADLSKVKVSQLNRKFDDVSANFRSWKVDKEESIKDFVENHGITYSIGKAYYELTKREEVQDYKNICIQDKKSGVIYSGTADELRSLLGVPAGQTIKLEPGNMATYRMFVQSTSVNRKLVRGTTLLYSKI